MKLADEVKKAKRVYLVGNGGSFANAAHIANDLLACGIKAYTLDAASLTASANDFGYETVFERWISTVGEEGDLLIALSGSGRSVNILKALRIAKAKGMQTWAVTGAEHGAAQIADNCTIHGPLMQPAEEYQLVLGHEVMLCLKGS